MVPLSPMPSWLLHARSHIPPTIHDSRSQHHELPHQSDSRKAGTLRQGPAVRRVSTEGIRQPKRVRQMSEYSGTLPMQSGFAPQKY